ncbi:MAG: hypothetical protein EOP84_26475, partial [Verrucomicrobiaceae bacterium]
MKKWLPHIILGIFVLWTLSALRPPRDKAGDFAVNEFGRLPVVFNGRFQPLDSLARNSLLQLREKQTAFRWMTPDELKNRSIIKRLRGAETAPIDAPTWLAEMFMKPEQADARPVFRIDNPDLKGLLGLPM